MKWMVFYVVIALIHTSCIDKTNPKIVLPAAKACDIVFVNDSSDHYVELLPPNADSATVSQVYINLAIEKLNHYHHKKIYDSSLLIKGFDGKMRFVSGNIFKKNKAHAVVQFYEAGTSTFFVFENDTRWKPMNIITEYGLIKDSAFRIFDYNFDGVNDLAIISNSSAGRYMAANEGSRTLYLYLNDGLIKYDKTYAKDFGLDSINKIIYLGDRYDNSFGAYKWKNNNLILIKSLQSKNIDIDSIPEPWQTMLYGEQNRNF